MDQQVTRQILWHLPAIFVVFLYGMLIPLAAPTFTSVCAGTGSSGWERRTAVRASTSPPAASFGAAQQRRPGLRSTTSRTGGRFFRFPYYLVGIIEV